MTPSEMEACILNLQIRAKNAEIAYNTLELRIERKESTQHDLAIWWEAYRVLIPIGWHWSQGQMHAAADVALEDYKAKAAELAGKK